MEDESMKKRLVSMLLVGAMAAALAVGCGNSGGGSDSGSGDSKEEQVTLRWMQFQVEYAEQVKNIHQPVQG